MYSIITTQENYINILTHPNYTPGIRSYPCIELPVDPLGRLLVCQDLCLEPADGGQFVSGDNPFGKVRSAEFFQDHKKVFISFNTFSKGRMVFNKREINPLILCLHCLGFNSLAALEEEPVDHVQQLGRVDRF